MSSLTALMVAIELAARKRDEARQALRERERAWSAAQGQLDQLQGYVQEMVQRWAPVEGAELKLEVMAHHANFMERLQHAIALQTRVVKDQSIRMETAQQVLMTAELRLSSLNKVVETRRRDMALAEMRREQKQTDERAALQFIGRTFGMSMQEA